MIEKKTKERRSCIQEIPEDILIKIISLLELKEAVRTSIISRRWRHLWKHIPDLYLDADNVLPDETNDMLDTLLNLAFDDDDDDYYDWKPLATYDVGRKIIEKFINNVDNILQNHHGAGVKHLNISFHLDGREHALYLDRWVSFAVTSRLKQLTLYIHLLGYTTTHKYSFPCHLFSSERGCHLEYLDLSWCSIEPNQNFDGFRNLRRLSLDSVDITDKAIQDFLSECVALKVLEINMCDELVNMEIPSPLCMLEVLQIRACAKLTKVGFCAPNLCILHYSGRQVSLMFKGALMLKEANMFLRKPPSLICVINQLHRDLPYLRTLELELKPKVFDFLESKAQLVHLKYLKLIVPSKLTRVASSFLKATPFLETFAIILVGTQYKWHDKNLRTLPECHHSYLKIFAMSGYTGRRRQLELVSFILTNAAQLEVMVIKHNSWETSDNVEAAYKLFDSKLGDRVPEHVDLTPDHPCYNKMLVQI